MKPFYSKIFFIGAFILFFAGIGHAADIEGMKMKCRAHAAKILGIQANAVEVKYEGQRTDKTYAVNGSAMVRSRTETFQCSFERTGNRITKFIVNKPSPIAKPVQPSGTQTAAPISGGIVKGTTAVASGGLLAGTSWRLVEFQSMDDAIGVKRPDDPSLYTMSLHADGTVTMRLNCNSAKGSWSSEAGSDASSGQFKFGPLAATRALCPPPSMDELIARHAQFVRSYLLKDDRLYLSLMADGGIYVWEPVTDKPSAGGIPAAPEYGGPRNWEVTGVSKALSLREQPSTRAKVIASYAPGTILDNLGCQSAEGGIWCDVQLFGGGPRGYVLAKFLKPAVSPDGSVAKGPDDSALRAGQGKFDATGNIPCAQSVGQPVIKCEFGVARAGGGYATVVVKKPDGRTRAIFFRMGKPIGADTSQADGYPEFRATKEKDLHLIRIGNERYEVPDAVILGG